MTKRAELISAIFGSLVLFFACAQASACETVATCKGIAFCVNKLDGGNGPTSAAITKAIADGDGNGIGIDVAQCQRALVSVNHIGIVSPAGAPMLTTLR
jgi:hypothetical protein